MHHHGIRSFKLLLFPPLPYIHVRPFPSHNLNNLSQHQLSQQHQASVSTSAPSITSSSETKESTPTIKALKMSMSTSPAIPNTGRPPPADSRIHAPTPWTLQSALKTIDPRPPSTPPISPIPFFHLLTRLKSTPREGWRRFSLTNTESIADHMYRMSLITLLAPASLSSRISIPHCTKMALVHDMAESIVGDITPVDGISKKEKSAREAKSMFYLTDGLLAGITGAKKTANGIREIWQEYEDNQTLEANFVHDVDKFELILQMVEYEMREEGNLDLGEFVWVAERIVLPEVRVWCAEVLKEREEFWKDYGKEPKLLDVGRKFIDGVRREMMAKTEAFDLSWA